ncbi:hypothetical protein B0A48_05656 [Cryoendolithus antarcticus]|uniref:FAD-binding domain-containing protein n=1 Tax=Cryoendolithus antarcticus TaxID=1507870 RepID=A0A1V8TBK7_9PEZI|nr:hypothetical protein B0A48_05656 [Cryoendolithus antarcticus]
MSTSKPFNIAIIGGGIGGLFAALCIHHHISLLSSPSSRNVKISVYEQSSAYREIGAGVGLGVNAARLIHKLGLGDKLNAIAGHRQGIWITFRQFDDGGEVVTVPVKDDAVIRQAPCARSDLLAILKNAVEDRNAAELLTSKECLRIEDLDGLTSRLHFSDSTTATANLVLASDGIHSATLHQMLPLTPPPPPASQIAYRAVLPTSDLPFWPYESYSACWIAEERHFLTFPISSNKALNIVAFVTKSPDDIARLGAEESWVSACSRRDVEKDFAGFETTVQKLIELMPEQVSRWKIHDRDPLHQWHFMEGRVALLGDAAHAMLPHLGAGAGQAMEDGWVLGRVVADYLSASSSESPSSQLDGLEEAMELYQAARLPRAQKTQSGSRAAGLNYELIGKGMEGLSFEARLEMMAEGTRTRMKSIWEEDLDETYERCRDEGR